MSSIVNFGPSSLISESKISIWTFYFSLDCFTFVLIFSNNCLKASGSWFSFIFSIWIWSTLPLVRRSKSGIWLCFWLCYSSKSCNFLMKIPRMSLFSVWSIFSRSWFLKVSTILLSLPYIPSLIKGFLWSISLCVSILHWSSLSADEELVSIRFFRWNLRSVFCF